jgi:hypothetical protein
MTRTTITIAATLVALAGAPGLASANDYTFCMVYHAETVDSGNGEDYYTSQSWWKARGAHVRVRSIAFPFPTVWEGHASEDNGCFSFSAPNTQFYVDLWAETRIGEDDNLDIRAMTAAGTSAPYWTILTSPGLTSGTRYLYGPASSLSNLIAIGTFSMYWFDVHASERITSAQVTTIRDSDCPSIPGNSCMSSSTAYIQPSGNGRKFLIGHEIGHRYYRMFRGSSWPFDCTVNSGGAACTYSTGVTTNEHSLHSKELASCALSEGFAHFFSTVAFNSHEQTGAHFEYYKEGYPSEVNVENGPNGGVTAFMENECSGSDDGHGVELDWLRMFWDYRTNAGDPPTHVEILEQMDAAHDDPAFDDDTAYFDLHAAADAQGFGDRLTEMAVHNGADH